MTVINNKIYYILAFNAIATISGIVNKYNTVYKEHQIFSTFLMSNNIGDIDKYLPHNLSEKDKKKIDHFINTAQVLPATLIHLQFYKNGQKVHLKAIYFEKKETIQSNNMMHHKGLVQNNIKEKNIIIDGENYSIISFNENKLCTLDKGQHNQNQIKEIIKMINLSLDDKENTNKNIKIIYHNTNGINGIKQIVAVEVLSGGNRHIFYIFTNKNSNDSILIVNEKGYIIPGKLLSITNQLPVQNGILGSAFGYRMHPILRKKKFHSGQDIKAPAGSEIFSMAEGTVVFANYHSTYGYVVLVYHSTKLGEGYSTLYAHCSKLVVCAGQKVGKGQLIGYVGSTGRSTGPHVHLEVIDNKTKQRLDPKNTFSLSISMIPSFFISTFLKQKRLVAIILKKSGF